MHKSKRSGDDVTGDTQFHAPNNNNGLQARQPIIRRSNRCREISKDFPTVSIIIFNVCHAIYHNWIFQLS